ncbi:MAG: cytochrome d ubiquinol oxidase subunit II [Chloroflexota bacterium]
MIFNTVWFILIAILYMGFFVLEGFDFGVGILLPFLGKNDNERRTIINTIGPHWDGNEVWLLTAGGATFAAFPNWYATMFSGFYIALLFLLAALILRGVAFEFRSLDENPNWRNFWDKTIFWGSFLPPLLLGVAFANIVTGVPIDQNMQYTGGFLNLLNWYGLLGGLAVLSICILHGAIYLSLKVEDDLKERALKTATRLWAPALVFGALFIVGTYFATDIISHAGIVGIIISVLPAITLLLNGYMMLKKRNGLAFIMTALTLVFVVACLFVILFPRVMISNLNPDWSLTIYNASSTPYTLQTMTIVTLIFLPFVLFYQGWSYFIFRKRLHTNPKELVY